MVLKARSCGLRAQCAASAPAPPRQGRQGRPAPRAGAAQQRRRVSLRAEVANQEVNVGLSDAQQDWEAFASGMDGEWEGVTATFSPTGQPQQLPERFVPEAFREWGVELWDWQSQCSSTLLALGDGGYQLKSVVRRLMPTVGCEADAVAFTEERSGGGEAADGAAAADAAAQGVLLVARSDGSYSAGPRAWPAVADKAVTQAQVEHCFALPAGPQQQQQQQQQRVRIKVVQSFRRNWAAGGAWRLAGVDLHRERHDGPYTGKRELAGCGGGQAGIAQLPPVSAQQLAGSWVAAGAAAVASAGAAAPDAAASSLLDPSGAAPEGTQVTLLPLGAWSAVVVSPEGAVERAEAGVLLQPGDGDAGAGAEGAAARRVVSCRVYSSGGGSGAIFDEERQL